LQDGKLGSESMRHVLYNTSRGSCRAPRFPYWTRMQGACSDDHNIVSTDMISWRGVERLPRMARWFPTIPSQTSISVPLRTIQMDDPYMHDYLLRKDGMDTYVCEVVCWIFCVITYILARCWRSIGIWTIICYCMHPSGHYFFHCDYSFILGKDPKKCLPVPYIRMTQDMVHGMGGTVWWWA
jgi:hypothetical protein